MLDRRDGERPGLRIAVDGPAASGKGTAARALARALGYTYVDTGTLYRTLALVAIENSVPLEDEDAVLALVQGFSPRLSWNGEQVRVALGDRDVTPLIRAESIGRAASRVAAHPRVRRALLQWQRELASAGGVVMDGRDIGSVERGIHVDAQVTRREIEERDRLDRERSVAPLVRLPDAFYLDTTNMSPEEVLDALLREARKRGA